MKTFEEFLVEMQKKHTNDYSHGKSGRVGGNPRYAGNQGYDKPDKENYREASKRITQAEIKARDE